MMISSVSLVLLGSLMAALSGLPALFFPPAYAAPGQRLSAVLLASGAAVGIAGAAMGLFAPEPSSLRLAWSLPVGAFSVAVDPLSAFFLFPVFIVPALGAVYGLGYWKQSEHPEDGKGLGLFYGLLAGSMGLVSVARDAVLFLVAWEAMALSAYFAATAESRKEDVREAGWVYLVATHIGTLVLLAMFGLLRGSTGSFALDAASGAPIAAAGAIFILALIGFGFKAGFMPLHVWLPGAHANAPSHVSALMSGVMLKMGVYGILRITGLLGEPQAWQGFALLAAGAASAVFGIAYALGQRDLKRSLAYSSIENLGIIAMGMGLALLGRAYGRDELVLLGLGGALLHVWNHSLFKSLLFLGSGAIIHAAGTRDIERMGGMGAKMPATAFLFALGSVAICALPPLNGFVSEWLLYLGFFKAVAAGNGPGLALAGCAAAALAMAGALALAAFVRLYGSVFQGFPRAKARLRAHDPGLSLLAPMALLASGCCAIGLAPFLIAPALEGALRAWAPGLGARASLAEAAPLGALGLAGAGVAAAAGILALLRALAGRRRKKAEGPTWDCGYAEPTGRMQYTGTSFAQNLVGMFSFVLWPEKGGAKRRQAFPGRAEFETKAPDAILERIVQPFFAFLDRVLPKLRFFQRGQTHLYVLYVAVVAMALFLFSGTGAGR